MITLSSIIGKKDRDESGFTLIEILVVILVIGILASIAIPVFLNQRQKANDSAAVSEATNVSKAVETYFTNNKNETVLTAAAVAEIKTMVKKTNGVGVLITGGANDFCVQSWHSNGKQYTNNNNWANGRPYYLYSSKQGGDAYNGGNSTGVSTTSCWVEYPNSQFTLWGS